MPSTSPSQHRLMEAAAHTPGGYDGVPQKVGQEFVRNDAPPPQSDIEVAKAIRDGELSSPQKFGNVWFFNLRVTGTGISHRSGLGPNKDQEEYVYRDPKRFLTPDFLEQCTGIPLIFEHPKDAAFLDTDEYRDRAIGTVMLPYILGDEVWAIGRVHDEDAATLMQQTHISTSPGMGFDESELQETTTGDGEVLRIEGSPSAVDHLAVVPQGVWDKGGNPVGIDTGDGPMTVKDEQEKTRNDAEEAQRKEEDEREDAKRRDEGETEEEREKRHEERDKERDDKARKDDEEARRKDAEERHTKLMSVLDSINKRLDTIENKGGDQMGKRSDESEEERKKREAEAGKKTNEELEGERKEKERLEKERDDAARRADAAERESKAVRDRLAAMEAQLKGITAERDPEDAAQIARLQTRADSLARGLNISSVEVKAIDGEGPLAYRRRLAAKFQKFAKADEVRKADVRRADASVLPALEMVIYNDAQEAAANPGHGAETGGIYYEQRQMLGRTVEIPHGDSAAFIGRHSTPGFKLPRNFQPRATN